MKLRATKKQLVCGVLAIGVLAFVGYGIIEPDTSPGLAVFHVGYSLPATRPAFLRFYQSSLRQFNGGYLPGAIDEFFVSRLWSSPGSREWQAIIDFQITQSSARWGNNLSHVHDDLKRQIIADIFHRLDTFSPREAVGALLLIESLRRNDALHKGGFSNLDLWTRDGTFTARADRLDAAKKSLFVVGGETVFRGLPTRTKTHYKELTLRSIMDLEPSPNHALQRTAPRVTTSASSTAFPPAGRCRAALRRR